MGKGNLGLFISIGRSSAARRVVGIEVDAPDLAQLVGGDLRFCGGPDPAIHRSTLGRMPRERPQASESPHDPELPLCRRGRLAPQGDARSCAVLASADHQRVAAVRLPDQFPPRFTDTAVEIVAIVIESSRLWSTSANGIPDLCRRPIRGAPPCSMGVLTPRPAKIRVINKLLLRVPGDPMRTWLISIALLFTAGGAGCCSTDRP